MRSNRRAMLSKNTRSDRELRAAAATTPEPCWRAFLTAQQRSGVAMAKVTIRYWAGAQAAAGTATEQGEGETVADVVAAASVRHEALVPVFALAALLMDGHRVDREVALTDGATLEVLPPFAGG